MPLISAFLALLVILGPGAHSAFAQRSPIGANVEGLDDWSTNFVFVDAFKVSRPWFSGTRATWQDSRPIDTDARGWVRSLQPGQFAKTLMFWELSRVNGQYPRGRYVVTFEGEGTVEYAGGARLVEQAPGRHVLDVNPDRGGIALFITATNPANYLRNISVRMPVDAAPGEPFYPPFLESMRNYRTIRFMNWMYGQQNQVVQEHWADRPLVEDARYAGTKGAPVEVMVELANRLNADPWFSMHHLATDDYVRNFALAVRSRLNPALKVYVEHSNEVWNGIYRQARYAQERGLALGLSSNPFEAQMRYHSLRSAQVFRIFSEVFPPERLVRVLGSFAANPSLTTTLLSFGDTASVTDVVAVAPYVGIPLPLQETALTWDVAELLRQMEVTVLPQIVAYVRQHVDIARRYGKRIVSYEGGQHLVGQGPYLNNAAMNVLYDAANRDPRMGSLYGQLLQQWSDATGGGLFLHLGHCGKYDQFGRFGSLEYLAQPRATAPKYDALQRWMEAGLPRALPARR
jgi:hypothetical protein